jgi:hypothetical protein
LSIIGAMTTKNELFPVADFRTDLMERIQDGQLAAASITVALPTPDNGPVRIAGRQKLFITDGQAITDWDVPSLRSLFRGTNAPPVDIEHLQREYTPCYYLIERHVLLLCEVVGNRPDAEFEDVYSNLRRRPDGRSLGVSHDFIWQAACLLLGMRSLSAAEFEAIIGRLLRSVRTFRAADSSRNYATFLRQNLRR